MRFISSCKLHITKVDGAKTAILCAKSKPNRSWICICIQEREIIGRGLGVHANTHHFRGIHEIYLKLMKKNRRKITTCNQLDLETIGLLTMMLKNLPSKFPKSWPSTSYFSNWIGLVRDNHYWMMMMERYSNLKEEVGGLIPGCEISPLLDINLWGGQLPHVLSCWPIDLLSQNY